MTTGITSKAISPYQKRQFIGDQVDFTNVEEVKKLYQDLLNIPIKSENDLDHFLLHRSELEAALEEKSSLLYINMSCHTDDKAAASAYQHFIEHVAPEINKLDHELNVKYLDAAKAYGVNYEKIGVYHRTVETDFKIFRDENVPIQTKLSLLSQEYQTLIGAMTVMFEGKEQTLPQMARYLQETDRNLRERAWLATTTRMLQDKDKLESLFDQMVKLRHQEATNAGFNNFVDYQFQAYHRFDYSSQHCKDYHQSVEKLVVPLWAKILERRKTLMKLPVLRSWDLGVDPLGRQPLAPFQNADGLVQGCYQIFKKVDEDLGKQFKEMMDVGLLDLESRKGKAPGGYMSTLQEARRPFIFMNAVGLDSDVRTLLHECGHAFHALACRHQPMVDYRHAPIEFSEVASMSMELLGGEFISVFYNQDDTKRSFIDHLEDVVYVLTWVATVDCFQHWAYENPDHSRDERRDQWIKIRNRFGGGILDWSGFEEAYGYGWHRQLHIFESPLYYIEYGIAQLGALGLWHNSKKDWDNAVNMYRQALSLGGSRPLPELFHAAGIRFDFSEKTIGPLVKAIEAELEKY